MVNSFEDDADLAKYFQVQRYRENKNGKTALAVYTAASFVVYLWSLRHYNSTGLLPFSTANMLGFFTFFPPIPALYYFAFLVSDPMELRDGMCLIGKIMTNLMMLCDSCVRGYTCYSRGEYIEMLINLLSLPIQASIFVPEHWPGATLMRPFVLRPDAEVEAERQDQISKWRSATPRV